MTCLQNQHIFTDYRLLELMYLKILDEKFVMKSVAIFLQVFTPDFGNFLDLHLKVSWPFY